MEFTKDFVEGFLKSHEFPLLPSQPKLYFPILRHIYSRMVQRKDFPAIRQANSKIVDGHHRYICSQMLHVEIEILKAGSIISERPDYTWSLVIVEENDWDNKWQIRKHQREYDDLLE